MEASERQLPIEPGDEGGAVRALDDRIVIERLTVQDERAAQLVRERQAAGQEPAKTVADAIEIGARVLDREDAAAEVDYVRAEFERQAGSLRERLARSLEEGDRQLAERIATSFDGAQEGSVQRQVAELVSQALIEQRTSLVKLFSAEDGANPLTDFKGAVVRALKQSDERHTAESAESRKQIESLTRELVELKQRQLGDERVAEAEEAGTRKGRNFEDRVHDAIERLAASRGDCAHHVGDTPGAGGSKKGDSLVEIGAGEGAALGRVVFEVKDSQLTKPKAWEELNRALAARGADYALLVVAGEEAIPTGAVEEMHEYQGNKLVVAVDADEPDGRALELAYRYAALRVRAAREAASSVDATAVRTAAAEARDAIADFRTVKSALTSAKNGVERARTGVEGIESALLDRLDRIEAAIDDPAEADPED